MVRKFRVTLEGSNVALLSRRWFRARRENHGFYTVRHVVADDEAGAEARAIALVRAELQEKGMRPFAGAVIVLRREEIVELSSFEDALVPGAGFTFFPAGS